ncbi:HAMP domain-containing protein [Smaragdicoccus niigatensis]|uniref:HAMP domain-containing sensor histidine kinase n=1 Tax=Smaragdicoccus niigatensis TaxID=359359 RepID=UPI0003703DDB|nr:HAMP domain-containing protein [Smaragdicoccus niigatensis]
MEADTELGFSDRLYNRLGWRLVAAFAPMIWIIGGFLQAALVYVVVRIYRLTAAQVLELALWLGLLFVVCFAASLISGMIVSRPLRGFARGEVRPEVAWRSVAEFPLKFIKINYTIATVATPVGLLCLAQVVSIDWAFIGLFAFGILALFLYQLALGSFLMTVFVRPALRSIASNLDGPPPPDSGFRLLPQMVFIVPALSVATALFGVGIGFDPGEDVGAAAWRMFIVTVIGCAATIPVTLLFARSVKLPIEDLLAGTKRVKVGDYSKPVPALSTNELGELARSFNEAMDGLAERQQLAREVRASRIRIVTAADESSRRVERNLHDGAQQHLVALALDLKLLEEMLPSMSAEESVAAVRGASETVKAALNELRELARGLHPAVLTTDGLGPALKQLASRAKVPVSVNAPETRFAQELETAVYFVAAEGLANIAKYAHASEASVSVMDGDGRLVVEVADNGIGGACSSPGSGLSGLADRVAALEGRLTVDSPEGHGTRIRADFPVA